MEAFAITKISRLPPRARNQHIGFSIADLDFDNFGASHGFVGILYSSRLILLYSNHLEGRQTVENHLVHIGTNSYQRTHVMMSSTSILVDFLRFLFLRKQVSPRKSRKFASSEIFPLYGIMRLTYVLVKEFYNQKETSIVFPGEVVEHFLRC